ncbi:MAG TPA: hypothetical protein PLO25_01270 [Candidatus Saccharibacteria bacterium]|nr:hypothetical protein [Candidatus Saccharibacteria bacterium]
MNETDELTFRYRYRFLLMIISTIIIAIVLVSISISMYYKSGAAQLDLSRPGYKSVRSQVTNDETGSFSATGNIDQSVINEFKDLYYSQAKKIKEANAFSGDPLDPVSLWETVE